MTSSFLYERLTEGRPKCTGTLAEPKGTPESRFALQGTVNWMHGLTVLVQDGGINWSSMLGFYKSVPKHAALEERAVNTAFEQLLMALHHLSALKAMADADKDRDLARIAVMTWYYGIYCAASAMIAAKDGSQQQDHAGTARVWDRQIAAAGLAASPFHYRLTTLVKKDAELEIAKLRSGNSFTLSSKPMSTADARGACMSYLSGTRGYREWQITESLKVGELAKRGLTDFRSAAGRKLRDERLEGKSLGFLDQAFRYRGKANYRDAMFLTYEAQVGTVIKGFVAGMETVLRAFVIMAGAFCSRRVAKKEWEAFGADLNANLVLSLMPKDVWG